MKNVKLIGIVVAVVVVAVIGYSQLNKGPASIEKITVAYFLEWPTANQVAQVEKTYDEELGVEVEWRAFGNGNEMTQAMVSGNVQIAYSQGFVPFVVGVTNNAPITLVGVAVTYAENDLCIVADRTGITQDNAQDLEGMKVATPIGNVTHYKLLRTLDHLNVDINAIDLVQMNPADAAVALVRGDVAMSCGFGGALAKMREVGTPLMTGAEQEAIGINTFDVITVHNDFLRDYPELVRKFMQVTEQANQAYKNNPDDKYATIANAAGMDLQPTIDFMAKFGFPSVREQQGRNWFNGGIQEISLGVAEVMEEAGNLETILDDYSPFITADYLQ
ncbi:MAG: ABC transporter substrate-binding protein [Alphaproteobacteria bacterium]|nr:ABC transporter substrate-binding protein [Alphaproteobacteria bacterium]